MALANPPTPITWLARPVPLLPPFCNVPVVGVASELPEAVRRYWLGLAKAAAPNAGSES
jgi:hypothetical protein